MSKIEHAKRSFAGEAGVLIDLPPKLVRSWTEHKQAHYEEYGAEVRASATRSVLFRALLHLC